MDYFGYIIQPSKPACMKKIFCFCSLFCFAIFSQSSSAQNNSSQRLKVFIDCNAYCDISFLKTELTWVDYVNDQFSANVYVLITSSSTGSGGRKYQIIFSGQKEFSEMRSDTLSYTRGSVDTDDEDRRKQLKTIQLGLTPYFAKTPDWEKLNITFQKPDSGDKANNQSQTQKDKWNSWIFNTSVNGNFNGNDNYSSSNTRLRFSAGRVTEKLKLNFSANYNVNKDKYIYNEYNDTTGEITYSDTTRNTNKSTNFNGTVTVSINDHWSVGAFSNFYTSTFSNIKRSFSLKPALEYSIFPYKTFNTKYMGFLYKVGPLRNSYEDTTWRNKSTEWLLQQNLSFDMNFTQKWGSVSASLYWSNYFFDWKWHNYGFFGNGQFRVIKGLNLNFFGGFSFIHDQVELPKGNATQTQVLIRQRILRNTSDYFVGLGISYRFGSIYNNVVNPRLGEAGGGFFFFD
jgi:hypothetical protein